MDAFFIISRGRRYIGQLGSAVDLDIGLITNYIDALDIPVHKALFIRCIFEIDSIFMDDYRKQLKRMK